MEAVGKFFTTLIMGLFSIIARGFVIMKLWAWFIVPIFALNALTLVHAIGFSLVVGLLTSELKPEHEDEEGWFLKIITRFVFLVIVYAAVLFEGWIISLFM